MGKNAEAQKLQEEQSLVESRWAYQGKYLQVRQDLISAPGQPPKIWDIATNPGAVAILPINAQGHLVLIEQWRRAAGRILLELPAGMLDPGEEPQICAQRELQEETGYLAHTLEPLAGCYTSPGMFTEYIHLFLATDLVESRLYAEDTHTIDVKTIPLQHALEMIARGEICDAKTVLGILRYAHR